MGCSCKNKTNQQSTQTQNKTVTTQTNNNVQESIKKVIQKYYKR
jgi:hypothetical protein